MTPVPTPFSNVIAGEDVLILLFYVVVGIYALFTAIFYYHWQMYSTDVKVNFLTYIVYFCTTIPLIVTLAAAVAL